MRWWAICLFACAGASLAVPAFASDASHLPLIANSLQADVPDSSQPDAAKPSAAPGFNGADLVAANVLGTQRGSGISQSVPLLPAPSPGQGVILWDEAKPSPAQPNVSYGGGQSVIQINIQPR